MAINYQAVTISSGFALAFISLSFGLSISFIILTFLRVRPHADPSRARPSKWLKITWVVLFLHIVLLFARTIMLFDDSAYERMGMQEFQATLQQLYLIFSLLSPPILACVLVLQVRLAQAVRQVSSMSSTSSGAVSRLVTIAGLGLISFLSIVRFAISEYVWAAAIRYDVLPHLERALAALDFLIALFLILGAIGSLAYTVIMTRLTPLRKVYSLLLAMNIITLMRELYSIIYVGIVSLGQIVDPNLYYVVQDASPALSVLGMFFHPLTTVIVLILAWAVMAKKKHGIWTEGHGFKNTDVEGRSMSSATVRRAS